MLEGTEIGQRQVERPGCITIYSILLWLGGGIGVPIALLFLIGFSFVGWETAELFFFAAGLLTGGFYLGLALLSIAGGIGIWGMKRWGWWLVVLAQLISLGFIALDSIFQVQQGNGGVDASGSCTSPGSVIVLVWFIRNRHLFES